ncbi:MAG: nucleotidyl transferase [Chloroflexi bacterium]|nr:MAG: nucleotidyl transferase [Chloroflexota bacterium]TME14209.1 MAG: nucleotidyl transferase [Chloroflexota bacterium]TME16006.1 MAG: nucleotidyl transferase [Chloroflexota bacterium]
MKAVVMAGGEGSRLRPLTSALPKPLVPVAGRPIMEHILLLLRKHHLRDVITTVQYLGSSIRNYFGDGSESGVSLTYSVEDSPLGTAGSVRLAEAELKDAFLVISGDALTDIDLTAAVRFHKRRAALATIVLKPVANPLEYGVVVVDDDGAVQRFLEKPSWGEVFSDLANTGIYILEPEVFKYFKAGQAADWSGDVFPQLLKEGEPIFGWVAEGYWEDVGTHAAYMKANFDCLEGKVAVEIPGVRADNSIWVAEDADVSPDARIDGPAFVGSSTKLRPGAWINGPAVIGDDCIIETGAKISNSILWNHTYVGENCRLRGAIVCRAVRIKNNSLLEEGSILGDEVVVGSGSTVNANVRVWPNKDIEAGATVRESIVWAGSWKRGLFSAYGLTGLSNIEFTPEFAARLGAAIGALFPRGITIAISRDSSRAARMIKRALIAGLMSSGANIADLSSLAIPNTRHFARHSRMPATVHVQTSPLDSRSVDIRIFDSTGLDLDKRQERKLENLFFREDIRRVGHYEMGSISYPSGVQESYLEDALAKLDLELVRPAGFKVLVDYDNGCAAQLLPRILDELNCTVIPLHASVEEQMAPQALPEFRSRLEEMGNIVRAVEAHLGVFIDSPGERCFLIDESGSILEHPDAFACLAEMAVRRRAGMIVGPASAPLTFSIIADRLGGRYVPSKITPGAVLRSAQHKETVIASDGLGGYCWPDFQVAFDAVFTVARVLELMAETGLTLGQLRSEIPAVGYETATQFCPWEAKGRVMRMVMEKHLRDRVDLTDGVKVFVEGGWVLVVPDPDHPSYHVIASTEDVKQAAALVEEYANLVQETVAAAHQEVQQVTERE